jgi:hypothetical protein
MYNKINTAVQFKSTGGGLTTAVIGLFLQDHIPQSIIRFFNPALHTALMRCLGEDPMVITVIELYL